MKAEELFECWSSCVYLLPLDLSDVYVFISLFIWKSKFNYKKKKLRKNILKLKTRITGKALHSSTLCLSVEHKTQKIGGIGN